MTSDKIKRPNKKKSRVRGILKELDKKKYKNLEEAYFQKNMDRPIKKGTGGCYTKYLKD